MSKNALITRESNKNISSQIDIIAKNLIQIEPIRYPNSSDGLELFKKNTMEYLAYVKHIANDENIETIIPDIESWCNYLGINRSTLNRYAKRSEDWQFLIENVKNGIGAIKKQLALKGDIPPIMAIFDLTNNHGYVNTNEFKINQLNDNTERHVLTEDEIRKKYGMHEDVIDAEPKKER